MIFGKISGEWTGDVILKYVVMYNVRWWQMWWKTRTRRKELESRGKEERQRSKQKENLHQTVMMQSTHSQVRMSKRMECQECKMSHLSSEAARREAQQREHSLYLVNKDRSLFIWSGEGSGGGGWPFWGGAGAETAGAGVGHLPAVHTMVSCLL